MEKDWVVVFSSGQPFEADIIHGMLMEKGINAVVVNGRDSVYGSFGEASIYVHESNAEQSRKLILEHHNG